MVEKGSVKGPFFCVLICLMTQTIPTIEPEKVVAGDTITWQKSLADYPATTYTLTYYLVFESSSAATPVTITAAASGANHLVTVDAADSADWSAGQYVWSAFASKTGERHLVGKGRLVVDPDPAALTAGTDSRSFSKYMLDAIEAVLQGTATREEKSIKFDGQELEYKSGDELLDLRQRFAKMHKQEIQAEKTANGERTGGRVLMGI